MIPVWFGPWLFFMALVPFEGSLNTLGLGLPFTFIGVGAALLLSLFAHRSGGGVSWRTLTASLLLFALNLSFWFSPDMDMSRHTLVPVNAIALIYFLTATVAFSRQEVEWSLVAWMRGGGVLALLIILSFLGGQSFEGRATFLFDPNYLAAELLMPFSAAFWLKKRKEAWFWGSLILAAILLTQSRGGLLAAWVILAVSLLQVGKRKQAVLFAALTATVFLCAQPTLGGRFDLGKDATGSGRTEIWRVAFGEGSSRWTTGVGFGTFPLVCSTECHFFAPLNVHNTYLQAFSEAGLLGILGLLLVLFAHLPLSRAPAGGAVRAGLIGVAIAAIFLDFLCYRLFWITLAIAAQVHLDRRNP